MALLVDPPQHDDADERPSAGAPPAAGGTGGDGNRPPGPPVGTDQVTLPPVTLPPGPSRPGAPGPREAPGQPEADARRLAEPPLPGGRVEALMGRLIRVLSHSRLARPLPAVLLSALGLGGIAFTGLCASAVPQASAVTPPVLLPLTALARHLGAPRLPVLVANLIMYPSISLCVLGLAMMLWANSRGWSPSPRKIFLTAAGAVAVLVNISPVGSGDVASYAAYGRIAALGYNPYTFLPSQLPGPHNAYTMLVSPMWRATPSVYGPVATWQDLLAASIGGARPWLTIWVLMIMAGAAFLATGYVLLRNAENPVRAVLLWTANPILILELVISGHLDGLLALAAIAAIVVSRRCTRPWHDLAVGLLVGVAGATKITAVFVALAIAIPLIHDRAWIRLARTAVVAAVTTFGLYIFSYGLGALGPAFADSKLVISPTIWRLVQVIVQYSYGNHAVAAVSSTFGFIWPPLLLLLAWYLYNRLSPDVPTVVAATCALTFAFMVVSPWQLPWYSSIAWVTLALLPRNSLTRWLTLATGAIALAHFNGWSSVNSSPGPTP
jgi:hypothetical protein